jgi:tetratricopeptide (TPR) repeat protein
MEFLMSRSLPTLALTSALAAALALAGCASFNSGGSPAEAQRLQQYNEQAEAALASGNPSEATALLQKVLDAQPGNPNAQRNMGIALLQQGKADQALPFLQRANAQQPGLKPWAAPTCKLANLIERKKPCNKRNNSTPASAIRRR